MERRPGLAPGKNWFASSRLDGFGMRRIKKKEPPAGIAPASIPFRRQEPDLFEPRGRKPVRQPGVAPGRPLWKSGMLELLNITGAWLKSSGTPVTLRIFPATKAGVFFLVPEETCARGRTCTGFLVCERDATRLLRLRGLENGGRDGCCPRSLLLDRQANMLLLLASETGASERASVSALAFETGPPARICTPIPRTSTGCPANWTTGGKWRTTGAWKCAGETAGGCPSGRYSRERERQHGGRG